EPGGCLALTTNLEGHLAELYGLLAEGLSERGDEAALERLRAHVAHRGTIASLTGRLERGGFGVESVHERQVAMRFGSGAAVLTHHFMRLGFVPGWREVAGAAAEPILARLRERLDRRATEAGEIRLTVPLALIIARPR